MTDIQQLIWESRYRAPEFNESSPTATFERVAHALSRSEKQPDLRRDQFLTVMENNLFLPGGRILANAGRRHAATLANCFVAGTLEDSLDNIFSTLRDCATTLQAGGGIGIDFSPLHPENWPATHPGKTASGPVSFLDLWNQMSDTLLRNNPRRGAMMGVLECSHPDILTFIRAKQDAKALSHFNLSVAITDEFMHALASGGEWPLHFGGKAVASVPADTLWSALLTANQQGGEPGVLFIDRINAANRLRDREIIRATNPCGELPLPPHGSCLLGSMILTSFVEHPFTPAARINTTRLEECTRIAVRFLDNAVDLAHLPLAAQQQTARRSRRIGLGITGLADALIMLGLRYDTEPARDTAAHITRTIRNAAYAGSCELAVQKGVFADFDAREWLDNPCPAAVPASLAREIRHRGLRNSHLTAIAPAGTISLLADNVSSGIEPAFDWHYSRQLETTQGPQRISLTNFAARRWRELHGENQLPSEFVNAKTVHPADQIQMVASLQPYVDSAVSKTVALAPTPSLEDINTCYQQAYHGGLKGLTCYPAQVTRGCVLGEPHRNPSTN